MSKRLFMLLAVLAAFGSTLSGQQQTSKKEGEPSERSTFKQAAAPVYKLAFAFYELQNGKKINERDYTVILRADNNSNTLKIGTRIPIETGQGSYTYADVGFKMDCSAVESTDGKVDVRLDVTVSNVAVAEQNTNPRTVGGQPIFRDMTQRVRTVLVPGKPQIVTSMDDVNSTKRMQVEVTATKVE